MYAFRCKHQLGDGSECGHLLPATHAGEMAHPSYCPVCKAGVEFAATDAAAREKLRGELFAAVARNDSAGADGILKRLLQMPLRKTFVAANWEVLADASADRLNELGLETANVERHVPFTTTWADGEPTHAPIGNGAILPPSAGKNHERIAVDVAQSKDTAHV